MTKAAIKRLEQAVKYLEGKNIDITSRSDKYYKRAILLASGIPFESLENINELIEEVRKPAIQHKEK